jgi:hypothetical protein
VPRTAFLPWPGALVSRPGLYDTTRYDYGFGGGIFSVICVQHTVFSASMALVLFCPGREGWELNQERYRKPFDLVLQGWESATMQCDVVAVILNILLYGPNQRLRSLETGILPKLPTQSSQVPCVAISVPLRTFRSGLLDRCMAPYEPPTNSETNLQKCPCHPHNTCTRSNLIWTGRHQFPTYFSSSAHSSTSLRAPTTSPSRIRDATSTLRGLSTSGYARSVRTARTHSSTL